MPNSLRELEVFSFPTGGTVVSAGETATGQFMLVEALEDTVVSNIVFQDGRALLALPSMPLGGKVSAYVKEFEVTSGSVIVWSNSQNPITVV